MFGKRKTLKAPPGAIHAELATNARQIIDNLIVTGTGQVWAGYRLGPVRWDFTSMEHRSLLQAKVVDGWAALAGRDVQERVTNRPIGVAQWAKALSDRTPNPADPDYSGHLLTMQRRIASMGMGNEVVFRYFTVGQIGPRTDLRAEILSFRAGGSLPSDDVRTVLADEKRVRDAVVMIGWDAVAMTEKDAGWLRQRSIAPGVPAPLITAPDGWDHGDLPQLSNDIRWSETPFDRTVEVTAWRDGHQVTRHVQILSAVRLSDLNYPESGLEPWQAFAKRAIGPDGRPFAVEWNLTGRLMPGSELAKRANLDLGKAESLKETYRLFDERPPAFTEAGIRLAGEVVDQVTSGQARDSTRFVGSINVAITGEDIVDERGRVLKSAVEMCEERADAFKRLYAGNELRMDFTAPPAQSARLREMVPGEGFDRIGYQRQVRLSYLAAGLPNVSSRVGDRSGPYIGYTLGAARSPVFHDSHFTTEGQGRLGRKQNMWAVVGSLGAGKSILFSLLATENTRRRTKVVIDDPSGPMMALCDMPEMAAVSRSVNLLHGERGILSPAALVREPVRSEFDSGDSGEESFVEATTQAWSERRLLTLDIARRSLDPDLSENREVRATLRSAASGIRWDQEASLWNLVFALERLGSEPGSLSRQIAYALRDTADMPLLSLMWPKPSSSSDSWTLPESTLLTVISTPGVRRAADGTPQNDWTPAEHAADPILRLTTLYADRILFDKPRDQRAVGIFDEAENKFDAATGRGYLNRLGRDHSKHNIAVYFGLKNLTDDMMGGELRNFLAGAFVGQMANIEPAEALLSTLHITDKKYARYLMGLSTRQPGEFVHLDADGNVSAIKIDIEHLPALKAAALTDPKPAGAEAWAELEGALL